MILVSKKKPKPKDKEPEKEKPKVKDKAPKEKEKDELEIVFICDVSGSMSGSEKSSGGYNQGIWINKSIESLKRYFPRSRVTLVVYAGLHAVILWRINVFEFPYVKPGGLQVAFGTLLRNGVTWTTDCLYHFTLRLMNAAPKSRIFIFLIADGDNESGNISLNKWRNLVRFCKRHFNYFFNYVYVLGDKNSIPAYYNKRMTNNKPAHDLCFNSSVNNFYQVATDFI